MQNNGKKCIICGEGFQPNNGSQYICSYECRRKAEKLRIAKKPYPHEYRAESLKLIEQRKDAAIRMLIFQLCRSISCGACQINARCNLRRYAGDIRAAHSYECYRMWAEEVKDFMRRVNLSAQPDCNELAYIKTVLER